MKIMKSLKRKISFWFYSNFVSIHTELVRPKEGKIGDYSVEIECEYPFNGTVFHVPKENIDNFEHRHNPDYGYLFVVERKIFSRELIFRIHLVPPAKITKEDLALLDKEVDKMLEGAVDKK